MKLPNWFKIFYWLLLTLSIGYFFIYKKYNLIESGNHLYLFIFLIWVAILLLPLFNEIKFFGIELKKDIDDLKGQINSLKLKLNNKNSQATNINVNPTPPSDKKIQESQKDIKKVLEETLKAHGINKVRKQDISTSDKVNFLFNIRYNIEKELRRINEIHFSEERKLPLMKILSDLNQSDIIDNQLYNVIKDMYSITSPAIHGEDELVTDIQFEYIKQFGNEVIGTLKEISD
jgi:hypothetical protein